MLWTHQNIVARIWPNDHCPPHVTFVCKADGWTARMEFSMVEPTVRLIDVKPVKNAPGLNLINELARQLAQRRRLCRKAWWDTQATVCLDNKQVERAELGTVRLAATGHQVGTVVPKSGKYVAKRVLVKVVWPNGSVTDEIVKR
jgi:hypothetical protein